MAKNVYGRPFLVLNGSGGVLSPEMDAAAFSDNVRHRIFENR